MNSKSDNRSVQRTKQLLKESLITLLQTTSITKISVTQLTQMANLNRGTFYLHYNDIYSLLDDLENDIVNNIMSILRKHRSVNTVSCVFPILYDFFQYIKENSNICQTLLKTENHNAFLQKIKNIVQEECFSTWDVLFNQRGKRFYPAYYSFVLFGCIGLMEYWIENGMQETPEEIAHIAESIIINGHEILKL